MMTNYESRLSVSEKIMEEHNKRLNAFVVAKVHKDDEEAAKIWNSLTDLERAHAAIWGREPNLQDLEDEIELHFQLIAAWRGEEDLTREQLLERLATEL